MDLFIQKLNEYGLKARLAGDEEKKEIDSIKENMERLSWLGENPVEKMKELIVNRLYILIKDPELFIEKMRLQKQTEGKSMFVFENLHLDLDTENEIFYFLEYDIDEYDDENVLEYFKANKESYNKRYAEWELARLFSTQADELIIDELFSERNNFIDSTGGLGSFKNLYKDLVKAVKKRIWKGLNELDLFIQKLEEYGLEARGPGVEPRLINNIDDQLKDLVHWDETDIKNKTERKVQELIANMIYLLVADEKKFISKMKYEESVGEKAIFLFENIAIDYDFDDENLYFSTYDMNNYGDEEVLKHIKENIKYYEDKFPQWKLSRIFDKTADEKLIDELCGQQNEFFQDEKIKKPLTTLFEELVAVVKTMQRR